MTAKSKAVNRPRQNAYFSMRYVVTLILCVLITLYVSLCVVGLAIVRGDSMQPTLKSGDVLVVNKTSSNFDRFDIVIIRSSTETIIKRIIGLPGETLQIRDGYVCVNDGRIDDIIDEKTEFAGIATEPITLGEDEYFVLGDNRNVSADSRYEDIGIISSDRIKGRVIFSLIPPKGLK